MELQLMDNGMVKDLKQILFLTRFSNPALNSSMEKCPSLSFPGRCWISELGFPLERLPFPEE